MAGTVDNCAGGITPWGTWLTCEETDERAGTHEDDGVTYTFEQDHGYVFEVDPTSQAANIGKANIPLKFLGRFEHEAAVVEEATGRIYLTEDADEPNGLFYRWTPPAGYRQGKGALHVLAADGAVEVGTLGRSSPSSATAPTSLTCRRRRRPTPPTPCAGSRSPTATLGRPRSVSSSPTTR